MLKTTHLPSARPFGVRRTRKGLVNLKTRNQPITIFRFAVYMPCLRHLNTLPFTCSTNIPCLRHLNILEFSFYQHVVPTALLYFAAFFLTTCRAYGTSSWGKASTSALIIPRYDLQQDLSGCVAPERVYKGKKLINCTSQVIDETMF